MQNQNRKKAFISSDKVREGDKTRGKNVKMPAINQARSANKSQMFQTADMTKP